ncbi:MAG: O-antigen ligase family protein [Bacillaceae bacterium]|nr:O-antigen ligase family protein [Bacillaceae bacterium]
MNTDILNYENKKNINIFSVYLVFFTILLSSFNIYIGFALKPYMIFAFIYFVFTIKKLSFHKPLNFELAMILFFTYFSLTSLVAEYKIYSLRLILGIILFLFVYFIFRSIILKISIEYMEITLARTALIYGLVNLIYYFFGVLAVNFDFHGNKEYYFGLLLDRNSPRLTGLYSDPNILILSLIPFLFFLLSNTKSKINKIGLVIILINVLLTLSRGGYIAIAFGIFIYIILSPFKEKIRLISISIFWLIISLFTTRIFFNINILSLISSRFNAIFEDNATGRFEIWVNGIELFKKNPLFGIGAFNFRQYNLYFFGDGHYMHNTLLEILVEGGLIGFSLYLLFLVAIFRNIIKLYNLNRKYSYIIATYFSVIISMMNISVLINEFILLFFVLVTFFVIKEYSNNVKKI